MEDISINNCPMEILCHIFKYLDTKALKMCMLVNRKWRNVAEYTVETLHLWENIIKNEMVNGGTTFVNKSALDLRNIFRNFLLWRHIAMAEIKPLNVYEIHSVKKMNVYKDNLILITNSQILYYDIKTYKFLKSFERSCVDFEENKYSVVELIEQNSSQRLNLYRKSNENEIDLEPFNRNTVTDVKYFRLINDLCYIFTTKNILWRMVNKVNRWEMEFIGRNYCSEYDPVINIHIHNEFIVMVSKLGWIWYAETHNMRFIKIYRLHVPQNISHHNWVLFDTFNCALPVTTGEERVKVTYDSRSDVMVMECLDLTCALQHGHILFLGFSDGRIEIRLPKKNANNKEPELYFDIQQFFKIETDCAILSFNVCETENSHILLVRTRNRMYQLQLNYPELLL